MEIRNEHVVGFIVGVGSAALGYYFYKKHQGQVDEFLRAQGIDIPARTSKSPGEMTIEELVTEKENLEDLIAEREHAAATEAAG